MTLKLDCLEARHSGGHRSTPQASAVLQDHRELRRDRPSPCSTASGSLRAREAGSSVILGPRWPPRPREASIPRRYFPGGLGTKRSQMDPGKDEEGVSQPPGPPQRKKFVIPLDDDEVPPSGRGNPVLKFVRNVPWEFGDVVPDYVLGHSTCALFLSLRYHNLHPDYIHQRLQSLGKNFALRVLLVQVDVKDPQQALKELAKMCILADCTLILAWSPEEAGRYLETYKAYEQKPADLLMEKLEQDFVSRVTECLTTVKSVNKTDSQTLLATFGSLEQLIAASREDLALCPGLGPQKARRLFDVLHEPFLKAPQ